MEINFFKKMKNTQFLIAALIALSAQGVLAGTTTLTFDEFPDSTNLTTQYQSVGVTVTGATTLNSLNSPWPANSGSFVAFSQQGLMTFTVDPTITGNIQTVSAYVSGDTSVGIYAYDSGGALVGQSLTPGATNNMLLTVTTSGNPIASISIHDGGSSFVIDTLDFVSVAPPPPPPPSSMDILTLYYNAVVALTASDFVNSQSYNGKEQLMLQDIRHMGNLLNRDTKSARLLRQIKTLRTEVSRFVSSNSPSLSNLLSLLDQLAASIPNDGSDERSGSKEHECT